MRGAPTGCLSCDADEFIDVQNRAELERYLQEVGSDVLMAPWINLVPTEYGNYNTFDATQDFCWSGRTSKFSKVVLSNLFAANNPDYHIHEGNHLVAPSPTAPPIWDRPGLPLLHVPIRSLERLKFKIGAARRLTNAKHNRVQGEGSHVDELDELLSKGGIDRIGQRQADEAPERPSIREIARSGWGAGSQSRSDRAILEPRCRTGRYHCCRSRHMSSTSGP